MEYDISNQFREQGYSQNQWSDAACTINMSGNNSSAIGVLLPQKIYDESLTPANLLSGTCNTNMCLLDIESNPDTNSPDKP